MTRENQNLFSDNRETLLFFYVNRDFWILSDNPFINMFQIIKLSIIWLEKDFLFVNRESQKIFFVNRAETPPYRPCSKVALTSIVWFHCFDPYLLSLEDERDLDERDDGDEDLDLINRIPIWKNKRKIIYGNRHAHAHLFSNITYSIYFLKDQKGRNETNMTWTGLF